MLWKAIWTLLSIFIEIAPILQIYAKRKDSSGYKTTYACEGKTLRMHCDEGIIHLIRANYGRFSISICNEHGNLEWSVNCMSHQSFVVMTERCSLKPECSVHVSSNTFFDACPGTLKYLEVQYHCGKDPPVISPTSPSDIFKGGTFLNSSTTTPGPPPPVIPAMTFATKRTTTTTVAEESPTSTIVASGREVQEIVTHKIPTTPVKEEIHLVHNLPSTTVNYANANYCTATTARGIKWSWTKAGEVAVESCPEGAIGNARWHCLLNVVEWSPEEPDLHQCRSLWLENLKERLENGEPIISVTSELAVKSLAKPLFSADIQVISDMVKQALYKSANSMENFLDTWHRYNVLRELLQSFAQILNNLLEAKQSNAWTDLPSHERKQVVSSLLHALDESALLLSEISSDDASFSLVKSNVLISMQIMNSKAVNSFHFPVWSEISSDEQGAMWLNMQDSVLLPRHAVKDYGSNGLHRVVFTAFNRIHTFLKPTSSLPFHHGSLLSGNVTRIINSKIIGASLDRSGYPKLNHPAEITFKHIKEENVTNPLCVFWDFHSRDWSTQGCWVATSNQTHTVCLCEHLTNFALVMDLRSDIVYPLEMETVHLIITIGSSIAIFSFLVTNIMMITYDLDMPESRAFIHKNIFFCLLLAEVVFVGGNKDSVLPLVCSIMAGCLQYLLLATFSWIFLECYNQYGTLVRPCDMKKHTSCWYYAAAYIVPGLLTGVSAAISPSSYGVGEYCWLKINNAFILSFLTPICILILGGFVFIILSVCMLSRNAAVTQEKDSVSLIKHRYWKRRSLFLIISSSITWSVGLFFMSFESIFLAYTFSVLNSVHSGTIMILYCFCYEKGSRNFRSIFLDLFWKKKKDQEPRSAEQSVVNVNESLQGDTERFRSLKKEKLYEKATRDHDEDFSTDDVYKYGRGTMPRGSRASSNWNYGSRNHLYGPKSTGSANSRDYGPIRAASPDSTEQFFDDHIYEAIDERIIKSSQHLASESCSPSKSYYGDQQSSRSNYGQQGVKVPFSVPDKSSRTSAYSPSRRPIQGPDQEPSWKSRDPATTDDSRGPMNQQYYDSNPKKQSSVSLAYGQKSPAQNSEPRASNALLSPTENSVVLAVLEGDKVVTRIQQEDSLQQQYKLSTFY